MQGIDRKYLFASLFGFDTSRSYQMSKAALWLSDKVNNINQMINGLSLAPAYTK